MVTDGMVGKAVHLDRRDLPCTITVHGLPEIDGGVHAGADLPPPKNRPGTGRTATGLARAGLKPATTGGKAKVIDHESQKA